jgi:hypothetical protein
MSKICSLRSSPSYMLGEGDQGGEGRVRAVAVAVVVAVGRHPLI